MINANDIKFRSSILDISPEKLLDHEFKQKCIKIANRVVYLLIFISIYKYIVRDYLYAQRFLLKTRIAIEFLNSINLKNSTNTFRTFVD